MQLGLGEIIKVKVTMLGFLYDVNRCRVVQIWSIIGDNLATMYGRLTYVRVVMVAYRLAVLLANFTIASWCS